MAKFKPVRKKNKPAPMAAGGLPCVIVVLAGFAFLMIFIYLVMKYSA